MKQSFTQSIHAFPFRMNPLYAAQDIRLICVIGSHILRLDQPIAVRYGRAPTIGRDLLIIRSYPFPDIKTLDKPNLSTNPTLLNLKTDVVSGCPSLQTDPPLRGRHPASSAVSDPSATC